VRVWTASGRGRGNLAADDAPADRTLGTASRALSLRRVRHERAVRRHRRGNALLADGRLLLAEHLLPLCWYWIRVVPGVVPAGSVDAGAGEKTALFAPFLYKMHYFTKTGSGQT
jgi:hypothetical protein